MTSPSGGAITTPSGTYVSRPFVPPTPSPWNSKPYIPSFATSVWMAPLPPTPTSALDPNARQMLEQQFDETVGRDLPDADPATRKKAFSQYVTHFTKFFNQYQTVTAPQQVAGMPGMPSTTVQQSP